MKDTLLECAPAGGQILHQHFGQAGAATRKENLSSVVTEADLASEKCILDLIRARFPQHNIIAEETGLQRRDSAFTWVVDPLDGTSNFAAGIPWFGVILAVLERGRPILATMLLPEMGLHYVGEVGGGVFRNGQRVSVTTETELGNALCAYGMDSSPDETVTRRNVEWLSRLTNRARNVRATNSLVDFCFTIDGRLGACINQSTRIWDIAAAALMLPEAGGRLTDLAGREITFSVDAAGCGRNYSVIGASRSLHPQVLEILGSSGRDVLPAPSVSPGT